MVVTVNDHTVVNVANVDLMNVEGKAINLYFDGGYHHHFVFEDEELAAVNFEKIKEALKSGKTYVEVK